MIYRLLLIAFLLAPCSQSSATVRVVRTEINSERPIKTFRQIKREIRRGNTDWTWWAGAGFWGLGLIGMAFLIGPVFAGAFILGMLGLIVYPSARDQLALWLRRL